MLTSDYIRPHIRDGCLSLPKLTKRKQEALVQFASALLDLTHQHIGSTHATWHEEVKAFVQAQQRETLLCKAIAKIIEDACVFGGEREIDPVSLRGNAFCVASKLRQRLIERPEMAKHAFAEMVADELRMDVNDLQQTMFADLKSEQRLTTCAYGRNDVEKVRQDWRVGQMQAVLLRALALSVTITQMDAHYYRFLFRKLKFLQLLFSIRQCEDGYEIEIDGPVNLLQRSTKYGLKLAVALKTLLACPSCEIKATISWGKKRRKELQFHWQSEGDEEPLLDSFNERQEADEELTQVMCQISERTDEWTLCWEPEIIHLPQACLCIPDCVFTHRATGERVYIEKLGYWSRKAVWQRIDMVEQGCASKILFIVTDRLRVSPKALGKKTPSALYVFKGKMRPKVILEHLEELRTR